MTNVVLILEATVGGTRRHVRDIVRGLAAGPRKSQFRLSVICSTRRDPAMEDDLALFRSLGVGVFVVPMRRSVSPVSDFLCTLRIARLLRAMRPDVVHTHSSKAGLCGRLAVRLLPRAVRPSVVHTPHGFAFDIGGAKGRGAFRALAREWERFARMMTDTLVCVSDHERRQALALGYAVSAVRHICNGVEPLPVDARPAAPLSDPVRPPRIRLFGRVCPQKGQEVLAAAVRELRDSRLLPETGLDVALYGTLPRRLPRSLRRAESDGLLRVAGPLSPEDALAEIAASDIVVLPSNWEAMPYVMLEALAAGRYVVAASVGGIPEFIVDGQNGLLISRGDAHALAVAILSILEGRVRLHPDSRPVPGTDAMLGALSALYVSARERG